MTIQAYAAHKADGKLEPFEYELGSLKIWDIQVQHMLNGMKFIQRRK